MNARIALVALAASAGALAQPFEAPPPPGPPRPLVIAAPEVATLDNGMRVVVAARRGLPLVTAELVIRSGSETDPASLAGLADITATLLTKGTAKHTAPQIAEAAAALGGTLDSGAGWYRATVSMTVTKPKAAAALALIAEVARTPRFAQAELDRARRLAVDGLSVALRDPGRLAAMAADRAAFGQGAFGHPAHGTQASLTLISRADVVAQHARYYRSDNATLVFVGDIDMKEARALAQRAFGDWKRPQAPMPAIGRDDARPQAGPPIVIAMKGAGQAGVAMVGPTIARSSPDYFTGVVGNALLGGGDSSRLNQEIRIKRGLSYGIFSRLDARKSGGVWAIGAQTKNESAPELVAVVQDEIRRIGDMPAPAEELEARKLTVIGAVSRRLETTEDLASTLAAFEGYGVPLAELTTTIGKLSAVTAQQVVDYARKHWEPGTLSIVIAGDADKFIDALRAKYPDLRVIAQDSVDLDRADLTRPAGRESKGKGASR
jgi:zinc protease